MKSKGKDEIVPEPFLTTDPKLIFRKPRPFKERYSTLLKIVAGLAGAVLALLLVSRLRRFL